MRKKIVQVILAIVVSAYAGYAYMYYPQQSMPIGEPVLVTTPDTAKYHNDCLHPCIRYDARSGQYNMAQSPYYAENNQIENPMFYESKDYMHWGTGLLICETPKQGYNSDPNIYIYDNGEIVYLWRECGTPLCDSLGCNQVTVGGMLQDGAVLQKHIYATNIWKSGDTEQCPIMIEHDGKYYIYAVWYQYEPVRKNLGLAIWEGTSLEQPDFQLTDTIPFESAYTCDKAAQLRAFGPIWYIPKPQYHDMWHFDLFEYNGKLYMVSAAEKGDNIMMSVADDRRHFHTFQKPLVNNHYTENYCGYRKKNVPLHKLTPLNPA